MPTGDQLPAWQRRIGTGIDLGIIVFLPVTTALLGLVLEDAFPLNQPVQFSAVRITVTAVSLIVLVLLVLWRRNRTRRRGTLYYVRYLSEWMSDWRLDQLNSVKHTYPNLRVITRWFTAPVNDVDVVDASADIENLGAELQQTMNDDRVDTGYNLAPNILFHAALALGYDMFRWDNLTLEELFDGPNPTALSWPLAPPKDIADATQPTIKYTQFQQAADTAPVLVSLELTGSSFDRLPPWAFQAHYRVGVFAGDTDTARPVIVRAGPARRRGSEPSTAQTPIHPWTATAVAVTAIRRALHENPNRTVVLIARVPKTVGLAIGWRLTNVTARNNPGCNTQGCAQESCLHPWRRLVPAHYDQENPQQPRFVPTRVHRGQPPVGTILSVIGGSVP